MPGGVPRRHVEDIWVRERSHGTLQPTVIENSLKPVLKENAPAGTPFVAFKSVYRNDRSGWPTGSLIDLA